MIVEFPESSRWRAAVANLENAEWRRAVAKAALVVAEYDVASAINELNAAVEEGVRAARAK